MARGGPVRPAVYPALGRADGAAGRVGDLDADSTALMYLPSFLLCHTLPLTSPCATGPRIAFHRFPPHLPCVSPCYACAISRCGRVACKPADACMRPLL